jgi:hypothetical protein
MEWGPVISGALLSMFEAGNMEVFEMVAMAVSQGGHEDHVICVFFLNRGYPPSIFRDMMNHRMP